MPRIEERFTSLSNLGIFATITTRILAKQNTSSNTGTSTSVKLHSTTQIGEFIEFLHPLNHLSFCIRAIIHSWPNCFRLQLYRYPLNPLSLIRQIPFGGLRSTPSPTHARLVIIGKAEVTRITLLSSLSPLRFFTGPCQPRIMIGIAVILNPSIPLGGLRSTPSPTHARLVIIGKA